MSLNKVCMRKEWKLIETKPTNDLKDVVAQKFNPSWTNLKSADLKTKVS